MKSTLKRAIVTLAVIGLLVVVPSMRGTWTQLSKQGRRVWHDVGVGMGLIAEPQPVSLSVSIKPDGSCTTKGKEWVPPVAVKTQVYDSAQTVSGTLAVYNQEQYPIWISAPTKSVAFGAGGVLCGIQDISTSGWSGPDPQPSPDPSRDLVFTFVCYVGTGRWPGYWEQHEFVYFYADSPRPWNISRDFAITTIGTERIWRTLAHSSGAGRDSSPVYSGEVSVADEWRSEPNPFGWLASFGGLGSSGKQSYNEAMGQWEPPFVRPIALLLFGVNQHKGITGYTYADCAINWSSFPLNFDGRQYNGSALRLTGSGNKIIVDVHTAFAGDEAHGIIIGQPYLPDFSDFAVVDRGGDLLGTLRIEGGFKVDKRYAWTLAYGDPGDTLYPTVDEIRAIGQYATPPGVTGLPYIDTDYEHQLWTPPLSFAINAASARAHKLI